MIFGKQAKRDGLMAQSRILKRESSIDDVCFDSCFLRDDRPTGGYIMGQSLVEIAEDDRMFDASCIKQEYTESGDMSGFACLMSPSTSSSSSSPFSSLDQNRLHTLSDSDARQLMQ